MTDYRDIFNDLARMAATIAMRKAREGHGVSIRDLNRETGISQSSIRQIEAGKRWPNASQRARLKRAFGEDFFDLPPLKNYTTSPFVVVDEMGGGL